MSMNFQSDNLPMSRVIIKFARGRTCNLSVVRVFVPVQVLPQVHVQVHVQMRRQDTHTMPELDALYCEGPAEPLGDG